MNELRDIIKEYKKISQIVQDIELHIKKQRNKKQQYEERIIELMKRHNITNKPIDLNTSQLLYKSENKPCAISQGYLENTINSYFRNKYGDKYGDRYKEEANRLYHFLLDNRPKKFHEKLYEKKSKKII